MKICLAALACMLSVTDLGRAAVDLDQPRLMRYELAYDYESNRDDAYLMSLPERFEAAYHSRVYKTFWDRMNAINSVRWRPGFDQSESEMEHYEGLARGAFTRSVGYGAREAFNDSPIVVNFYNWLETRQEWVGKFVKSSMNDIDEQEIKPLGNTYQVTEEAWRRKVERDGGVKYGVRPFNFKRPYAFMSWNLGPKQRRYLETSVRYYFRDYDQHRFEGIFTVPIDHGFAFRVGARYIMDNAEPVQINVRLQKHLNRFGYAFIGADVNREALITLGFASLW